MDFYQPGKGDVMAFDEPASNLDAPSVDVFREALRKISQNRKYQEDFLDKFHCLKIRYDLDNAGV